MDIADVLPGGVDVVFDGIGEDDYRRSFAALKAGGLLCAYGYSLSLRARRRQRRLGAQAMGGGPCFPLLPGASSRV